MDELKFVFKCLGFSVLLLILMQVRTGNKTIEEHVEDALINTKVSSFVNKSAQGGVKLIKDGCSYVKVAFLDWKNGGKAKTVASSSVAAAGVMSIQASELYKSNLEAVKKIERIEAQSQFIDDEKTDSDEE